MLNWQMLNTCVNNVKPHTKIKGKTRVIQVLLLNSCTGMLSKCSSIDVRKAFTGLQPISNIESGIMKDGLGDFLLPQILQDFRHVRVDLPRIRKMLTYFVGNRLSVIELRNIHAIL